ncbi:MAG: hypothetical protein COU40_03830 [Candidatus Moranbacteria bacterium CG10_big_fil_rev_8_21_14_0_10_35_21]|nr:MAG: hypothetical protein COU40_03830 [Candidatus Moranbacteria bacterium CG10_big_fil_rev_8_21_14_0_10_35_21]PJA88331.1 MAG: hypothetical protein CO139_03735 [Candidatus Moranbacteria bacterium CG_4_9_14_3_um_filter_36_9]
MSLDSQEQLKKFLEKSQEVLILIPENPSGDAIGSAWALYFFLEKIKLVPTIAFANHLSSKFDFLPKPERILTEISGARDFVLSFDTTRNNITNLRSETKEGHFNIYLTPEKGSIDPRDFSFILAKFKYNLVIVLDSPDLEKLGKIYESNSDLFFEVPVVNIDYRSNNENFGQINLVDVTASSCSEILNTFLENSALATLDETISQCLLSGIISATESFQKKNTTPRALLAAANLMDKGANQQEIIRWLYKTQPLNVLKLWGRIMAKLNWDEKDQIVWSEISVEDFVQSRSSAEDLYAILEKLRENYSEGRVFIALYNDTPFSSIAVIKSSDSNLLEKLLSTTNGKLHGDVLETRVDIPSLTETGQIIVQKIKQLVVPTK